MTWKNILDQIDALILLTRDSIIEVDVSTRLDIYSRIIWLRTDFIEFKENLTEDVFKVEQKMIKMAKLIAEGRRTT